jgi:hypothetical protein
LLLALPGCHMQPQDAKPTIQITHMPVASLGGPKAMDYIEGKVSGARSGDRVVLYAHSEVWWLQPFRNAAFTNIQPDSTWRNSTHLGTEYAAMLVETGYRPPAKLGAIPDAGNGVRASTLVKGTGPAVAPKTLHFSGYEWIVQEAENDTAGETQSYEPGNAWVDQKGYLHVRMGERDGHWYGAELHTARSFGYGSYRFVVQNSGQLDASGTLRFFLYDLLIAKESRNDELDIEISRWDNQSVTNARYVVQPFYVAGNSEKFNVPAGELTHLLQWEPGKASFKTMRGTLDPSKQTVDEKVFTAGVPVPANHKVYIDLLDFLHSRHPSKQPTEVVIEKFDYLP